jgi:hypothetical protein
MGVVRRVPWAICSDMNAKRAPKADKTAGEAYQRFLDWFAEALAVWTASEFDDSVAVRPPTRLFEFTAEDGVFEHTADGCFWIGDRVPDDGTWWFYSFGSTSAYERAVIRWVLRKSAIDELRRYNEELTKLGESKKAGYTEAGREDRQTAGPLSDEEIKAVGGEALLTDLDAHIEDDDWVPGPARFWERTIEGYFEHTPEKSFWVGSEIPVHPGPDFIIDNRDGSYSRARVRFAMRRASLEIRRGEAQKRLIGEGKKPGYTGGQHGGTVGETAEYYAAADYACDRGLSVGELREAIEQKLAEKAKAAARETTARATAEPRPDGLSPELATALLKDSTLGQLQERFEKQLSEIELPEGGFTTIGQARAGSSLATTFDRLQKRRKKFGLAPILKPARVEKAARLAAHYYDHHTATGEFIPPKPRGRPRKTQPDAAPR